MLALPAPAGTSAERHATPATPAVHARELGAEGGPGSDHGPASRRCKGLRERQGKARARSEGQPQARRGRARRDNPDDPLAGLAPKERKFVLAYVGEARGNATRAAELAGYGTTRGSMAFMGHSLLRTDPSRG